MIYEDLEKAISTSVLRQKVWDLDALADRLRWNRQVERWDPWPAVVHAHGCFDVLHVGHVRHLRQAREMGDLLVVTVTPDEYVDKGPNRPLFAASYRAEVLSALDCVDYVAVNRWPTAAETIELLRPNLYVKGPECRERMTAGLLAETKAVRDAGGEVRFTGGDVWSSTEILRKLGM